MATCNQLTPLPFKGLIVGSPQMCVVMLIHSIFFIWPWPDDLDIWTWPRHSQDVPAHQKWSV